MKTTTEERRIERSGRRALAIVALVVAPLALGLVACDVTNPGNIVDENLDREEAFAALVNGMAADFSLGFNGANSGAVWFTGVLFGDIWAGTSGVDDLQAGWGDVPRDRPEWANWVDPMHSARWVAEDGVRRMKEGLGEAAQSSPLVAEGLVWAGFSNRLLGDVHCEAVIDNGPPQPRRTYYERAEDHFSEAIDVASSAGANDVLRAAYGGRASVRLILDDLAGAAQDAGEVPTDYEWVAFYNEVAQGGRGTNAVWHETHPRRNITVGLTWIRDYYLETGDPRVPSLDQDRLSADGISPHVSEEKYPNGTSNVPLTKGSEMRLIEAEALIRNGDWEGGLEMINDLRAEAGVDPWEASSQQEAFEALIKERAIVLWLEARRGGEFYRLNQLTEFFPGGYGPTDDPLLSTMVEQVRESLPGARAAGMKFEDRDTCFTFSETIFATNPELSL